MTDIVLATGPWVGGDMTIPHRRVLVLRTLDDKPEEFVVYTQQHERGSGEKCLTSGHYMPVDKKAPLAAQVVKAVSAFAGETMNHVAAYPTHVLFEEL